MERASPQNERAISEAVEAIEKSEGEMVRFLSMYVQQNSVNATIDDRYGEGKCQDWLASQLEEWKCFDKVDRWEKAQRRPNVVAVMKGRGTGKQALGFLGHSDVVPVVEETVDQWTSDPWGGEVKDGKVYGRGVCDMKGGNVAFLWAMRTLAKMGVKLRRDVYGAAVIGEETGEYEAGVDQVLQRGYTPGFVVCAEPSNFKICPVTPGAFFFKLVVYGKAIHTSQRYKCIFPQPGESSVPGVDAVIKATKFLKAFEELEWQWGQRKINPLLPRGSANLTPALIKGGEYIVALAERCEVIYSVWYNPAEKYEDVAKELRDYVKRICDNDDWLREHPPALEMPAPELPIVVYPMDTPLDHPGCKATAAAFESSLGRKAEFDGFTAATDLNYLTLKGIPGIILGPGDISDGVHGIDEYLPVKQLVEACKVYAATIVNWCGVSG
jgi:acetylornithine deacetylase/succinyl-diaminopimelate desuccinylase family protein